MRSREAGMGDHRRPEEPTEPKKIFAAMTPGEQQEVQRLFDERTALMRERYKMAAAATREPPRDLTKDQIDTSFANAVRAVYRQRFREPRDGEHISS